MIVKATVGTTVLALGAIILLGGGPAPSGVVTPPPSGQPVGGKLAPGVVPRAYVSWYQRAGSLCAGVTPALLATQGYQESGFNPLAVSGKHAYGIAQFRPSTFASWAKPDAPGPLSPYNPGDAIMAQGRMMCSMVQAARQSGLPGSPIALALAGYNAGFGAVQRWGGIPPYPQTVAYVPRILAQVPHYTAQVG